MGGPAGQSPLNFQWIKIISGLLFPTAPCGKMTEEVLCLRRRLFLSAPFRRSLEKGSFMDENSASQRLQNTLSGYAVRCRNHRIFMLPKRVLLIENDAQFGTELAVELEKRDHCDVHLAGDSFEAGNLMSSHAYDLIISDWNLPEGGAFSALRMAERGLSLDPSAPSDWFASDRIPVIVLTSSDTQEIRKERKIKGHFQFLGAVSREQSLVTILDELELIYSNMPSSMPLRKPATA
jgi:CheY-like chemotaxis protein